MNEWGKVVGLKGKTAILSIQKSDVCEKCRRCRPGREENEMIMEAKNKIGAKVGDIVELNVQTCNPLIMLFIRMGIPLIDGIIGGLIGYAIAHTFSQTEGIVIWVIVTGIIVGIVSFILSGRLMVDINQIKVCSPVINSIIHKSD